MRRLGVFLGFQPGVNLASEGISRLLAFILKENIKTSDQLVIFCPAWLIDSLQILLKDNKIPVDNFEIITTNTIPLGVRIKELLGNKKKKKKKVSRTSLLLSKIKLNSKKLITFLASDFFSTSSIMTLILKSLGYLLLIILALPFAVLLFLIYSLLKVAVYLFRPVKNSFSKAISNNSMVTKFKSILAKSRGSIYQMVIDGELKKLVNIVNVRTDIGACFVPSMAWPQIKDLKCGVILAAPDIVFYDFPTQFKGVGGIHKRIRDSISSANRLICYSNYVRDTHLYDKCGVPIDKITVIKHANVDMNQHLEVPKAIEKFITMKQNARQIVNKYISEKFSPGHVLYNTDIDNFDYVIYSSQFRPHKNIPNLIKGFGVIKRDFQRDVKLIVTGDILKIPEINEIIRAFHLENDIFVFHNISSELLAALNTLAKCAVNPTLFEGGFPFTFSEAYSVGTPSVMSKIPVVVDEIKNIELRDKMLFDPENPFSIAEKILWAIDNTSDLYKEQEALYQQFSKRDWKVVASEYSEVFNQLIR